MRFYWLLVCLISGVGLAAPTGNLAFIRDGGVFVGPVNGYQKLISKSLLLPGPSGIFMLFTPEFEE